MATLAKIAKIMNHTDEFTHDFARPKTSYRKLYAFQKAEAIYDLTYYFCPVI